MVTQVGLGKETKTTITLGFTKSNELFVGRLASAPPLPSPSSRPLEYSSRSSLDFGSSYPSYAAISHMSNRYVTASPPVHEAVSLPQPVLHSCAQYWLTATVTVLRSAGHCYGHHWRAHHGQGRSGSTWFRNWHPYFGAGAHYPGRHRFQPGATPYQQIIVCGC